MDNYDATVDPDRPLGYRHLRPAETFEVDPATGEIARTFVPAGSSSPRTASFARSRPSSSVGADRRRPARTGDRRPARRGPGRGRRSALAGRGGQPQGLPADRDDADRVTADSGDIADHDLHPLAGVATTSGRASRSRSARSSSSGRPRRTRRSGCASPRSRVRLRREPHPRPPDRRPTRTSRHRLRRQPRRLAGLRGLRAPRITVPGQIYALDAQGEPRIPGRRLRRPGPRLADRTRPDPAAFARVGVGPRVRPGRAAGPQRGRRAGAGAVRARCPGRRPGWSRPRRSSGGPSRRFG